MSFVLFHISTGVMIQTYESESDARNALGVENAKVAWLRINNAWIDGYECEYCSHGLVTDYGPYGITEYERWFEKFRPGALKWMECEIN